MIPDLEFPDPARWRAWLARNHRTVRGGLADASRKKGAPEPSVTYAEALDEALCFGWIDGQKKSQDARRVPPEVHPAAAAEHLVEAEHRALRAARRRRKDGAGRPGANRLRRRPTDAGVKPTTLRAGPPHPRISSARSAGTVGPGSSSRRSTAPTATPSPGACRPRSVPRPGPAASRRSWRCWPREGRSTREQVRALHLRGRDAGRRPPRHRQGLPGHREHQAVHRLRHRVLPGEDLPVGRGPHARRAHRGARRRGAPLHSAAAAAPGRDVAPRLGAGGRVACRSIGGVPPIDPGRLARAPSRRARPARRPGWSSSAGGIMGLALAHNLAKLGLHRGGGARARLPLRRRQRAQRRRRAHAVGHRDQRRARPPQHRADEAVRGRDGHQRLAAPGRLPVPRPDRGGGRAAAGQRRAAQPARGEDPESSPPARDGTSSPS